MIKLDLTTLEVETYTTNSMLVDAPVEVTDRTCNNACISDDCLTERTCNPVNC